MLAGVLKNHCNCFTSEFPIPQSVGFNVIRMQFREVVAIVGHKLKPCLLLMQSCGFISRN